MSALAAETLAPLEIEPPQDFGASPIDGLQYADPTEALGLIEAPQANEAGTVSLTYPIDVPPGHGITPGLALQYDSSGGNGWLGVGWSLDVPAIEVDTAFGAPHFDAAFESESYLHDGQLLVPNAVDDDWEPRVSGTRRATTPIRSRRSTARSFATRSVPVARPTTSGRSAAPTVAFVGTAARPTVAVRCRRRPRRSP